ncbi:hypothetical protein OKW41_003007 [Paraburkholderia sp. UCT70]|uniref:hypothetical protein n=1 Tax=Paraburkholderia sp. UCT70 TaxID=2991068 RepID=UPI003D21F727
MTDNLFDLQHEVTTSFISTAETEYKSLSTTYETIDRKAQATTAVAGVFLAAVFALASHVDGSTNSIVVWLVFLLMIVLLTCVVLAVGAMFARATELPPTAEQCLSECSPVILAADPDSFRQGRNRVYSKWADEWVEANRTVHAANQNKALWLFLSQIAVLVAAALTVFLGALLLFTPAKIDVQSQVTPSPKSAGTGQDMNRAVDIAPPLPSITVSPTITVDTCSSCEPRASNGTSHISKAKAVTAASSCVPNR